MNSGDTRKVRVEVEERRNEDGTLDEVVLSIGGECVFHLEQTTPHSWYFGLYGSGVTEQYWINAKGRVRIANYKDAR